MSSRTALWAPRRVRITGLTSATDATITGISTVGEVATGSKITARLSVASASGGLVTCSGVVVYPSMADDVVIGHFSPVSVQVPAGGTASVNITTEGVVASIYAKQSLELLFTANSGLSNVPVGTPVSSLSPEAESFVPVSQGGLTTSPYFIPAAIGVGVLAIGGLALVLLD